MDCPANVRVQERRVGGRRTVCGRASGTGRHRPAQGRCRRESPDENRGQFRQGLELGVSCDHLLLRVRVAVELAEEGIAVLLGPVGQLLDEVLNLFAGGLSERLCAAEVDGVGLYQFGIELVLADDLAETVADLGATAVPVSIRVLGRKLFNRTRNSSRSPRPSRCRCRRPCVRRD